MGGGRKNHEREMEGDSGTDRDLGGNEGVTSRKQTGGQGAGSLGGKDGIAGGGALSPLELLRCCSGGCGELFRRES